MTRRGFVRQAGSAGAAAALAARGLWAKRISNLKFGLTSYQWGAQWDIPTFIANCTRAKAFGIELRTSNHYKHGVETDIGAERRREVKRTFADSPVRLVGINSGEMLDAPDAAVLRKAIEAVKAHVLLAHDVGATGVRVFPNNFHPDVPPEQTLAQIARSLNEVGAFARDYGLKIRLEAHGPVGTLPNLRKIMDQVDQKNVVVKLNGDPRDNQNGDFAANFALVRDRLGDTLHFRMYGGGGGFPYQLQWDLLIDAGWEGWCMVEESVKVPDIVQALIEEREAWEKMIAMSVART
jgi:sugar phosphate isomerase/epimerase